MENSLPAMVTVHVRVRGIPKAGQEATVIVTVLLPVPLLGLRVTHSQGLVALHVQCESADTFTDTEPPYLEKLALVGLIE